MRVAEVGVKTVTLFDHLDAVRAREAALGFIDTHRSVEAMRNNGGNRASSSRVLRPAVPGPPAKRGSPYYF